MQDSGSLAVFKVTARDQGQYKGLSGAFVTYCNISCYRDVTYIETRSISGGIGWLVVLDLTTL